MLADRPARHELKQEGSTCRGHVDQESTCGGQVNRSTCRGHVGQTTHVDKSTCMVVQVDQGTQTDLDGSEVVAASKEDQQVTEGGRGTMVQTPRVRTGESSLAGKGRSRRRTTGGDRVYSESRGTLGSGAQSTVVKRRRGVGGHRVPQPETPRSKTSEDEKKDKPTSGTGRDTRSTLTLSRARSDELQSDAEAVPPSSQCNTAANWKEPNCSSYHLSGRVEGKAVRCLVDSGSTTNILSRRIFDCLPERKRSEARMRESAATLADGSSLPFYGQVNLYGKLGAASFCDDFLISRIKEDVILGMPFLEKHNCAVSFKDSILEMDGVRLRCTDRHGRPVTSRVQVIEAVSVTAAGEQILRCRLVDELKGTIGVIEGTGKDEGLIMAASVNQPGTNGEVMVRVLNVLEETIHIPSGECVAVYTVLSKADIVTPDEEMEGGDGEQSAQHVVAVDATPDVTNLPDHLKTLYMEAKGGCQSPQEEQQLARLLCEYSDVFSKGED